MSSTRPALPMTGGCPCGPSLPDRSFSARSTTCQLPPFCPRSRQALSRSTWPFRANVSHSAGRAQGMAPQRRRWRPLVISWFCATAAAVFTGGNESGRPESITSRRHLDYTNGYIRARICFHLHRAAVGFASRPTPSATRSGPDDFGPLAERWRALWPDSSRTNSSIFSLPFDPAAEVCPQSGLVYSGENLAHQGKSVNGLGARNILLSDSDVVRRHPMARLELPRVVRRAVLPLLT